MLIPDILTVICQGFSIYSKYMGLVYLGRRQPNLQIPAETPIKWAFFFAAIGHCFYASSGL